MRIPSIFVEQTLWHLRRRNGETRYLPSFLRQIHKFPRNSWLWEKRSADEIAEESSIRSESAGFRPVDRGESRSREKSLHSADAKAHSTVTFHYPSRALSPVRDRAKLMDSSFFSPPPAPLITPLTHALDLLIVAFLPSFVGRLPRPINSPSAISSFCSGSRADQQIEAVSNESDFLSSEMPLVFEVGKLETVAEKRAKREIHRLAAVAHSQGAKIA